MYTLTINIAHPGTPMQNDGTNNPGYSTVGHMWYELSDNNNTISSFGFAPDQYHHGQPFAPGDVYRDDSQNYLDRDYTRTVEITQEQYEAMKSFGEDPVASGFDKNYDGADNSCIDFAWKALEIAGFNPLHIEGMWWPTWNGIAVDYSILISGLLGNTFEALKALGNIDEWQTHISEVVGIQFTSATVATQPVRRDPLTLDLDGDGLETTGVSTTSPIYFDHDADGIKTATGWVNADDAFLVVDKNANGKIDNGRELFGDAFVKSNGQLAADGFDALKDLDSNADGKVDANDAQFASLRLWRDLNQDGVSQSNELFTLVGQNIAAINVGSTEHSQILANGNQLADIGTFIKTDGSSGTLGEVSGQLGDVDLAQDTFHRQFTDTLDTRSVSHLPDMRGAGAVRDLREAANNYRWRMAA